MQRLVECQTCGHKFVQEVPDVSAAEAARLKSVDDDSRVMFRCPQCQEKIWRPRWALSDMPAPP
jgi:predicted RNA-binding Zn-ribbon protein involved in translation (DUF1610 family)